MAKKELDFKSTKEIKVPNKIIDQVLGQDAAVEVVKKAAKQRRHVFLIGEPGTGKSMLGLALAELLPKEKLVDILAFPNPNDENTPLIRTVPGGKGRDIVLRAKIEGAGMMKNQNLIMFILVIIAMLVPWWARKHYQSDIMFAAFFLGGMVFLAAFVIFMNLGQRQRMKTQAPKMLVDNFKKKQVPFYDATGAHAGALLGDVLHDPFQCFYPTLSVTEPRGPVKLNEKIDSIFAKDKRRISMDERNYEAIFLDKDELHLTGVDGGSIAPVEVLSANRHDHDGRMLKITTSDSKELIVTPGHKIAVRRNGGLEFVEAERLQENDDIISVDEDIIIDGRDIICTYERRQQEQCRLYYQYQKMRSENPSWGYKRIAKMMGQPIGKTRWWHEGRHKPVPVQAVEWLEEKGLIPLRRDNPNLSLIAKVIGATFGDGGIFENMNGIFLSSSEKMAVEEFGRDIEGIFDLEGNSRISEGGEYGHSWCYQNTNRNIIRFMLALGAPRGNKTGLELMVPDWINLDNDLQDEFYGSFFGSELGVPKVHKHKNRLQTFDIAITGSNGLESNRIAFFNGIKAYLEKKDIVVTSVVNRRISDKRLLYRLLISIRFDNILNFMTSCKINYCDYKKQKLIEAMEEFSRLKRDKYDSLMKKGKGAEHSMRLLNLTPSSLYIILNYESFDNIFEADT